MPDPKKPRPTARLVSWGLHTYWRFSRGLTLGVRGIVVDASDRVFLIRHTYVPGWHLPGGGVERGETAIEAVAKELAEEGNVTLGAPPVLMSVHLNRAASAWDHVLFYRCEGVSQTAPKLPDREIAEAGFFPLDRLPEGTTSATRRRLSEALEGHPAPELW